MDPLSHIALGRMLLVIRQDRHARQGAMIAVILGALAPDIDAVLMPFGWDRYLRVHQIGTHTVVGTAACALLTAAVVSAFMREAPYRRLASAAWVGATSHVVLDMISGARLQIAWPLTDGYATMPFVAMADPVLAGPLVAGLIAVWIARRRRLAAAAALTLIAALLVVKAVFLTRALSAYRATPGAETTEARVVEARWATLRTWNIFDRTSNQIRFWRASGRSAELMLQWPLGSETAVVVASRSLSTVKNFFRVHALGFPVTITQPGARCRVLWSDIRYCWDPAKPGAPQSDLVVSSPLGGDQIACGLWFGGDFDSQGRAVQEIVKIGRYIQSRDADP